VGVTGSGGEAEGTRPDPYGLGYAQYPEYMYIYKRSRYPRIYVTESTVESVWLEVSVNFVSLVNDGRVDFKLKLSETYPT